MHDVLVVDPLSHFLQQPVMPDIVKVGSQIKVEDPRLPLSYCFSHSLDRVVCCPLGPISIRPRLEVRLEHRFEDELERTLHHSVPDRRDRQDADFAPVFRYLLLPGWEWLVGAPGQFIAQLLEQSLHALRLDGLERDPVYSRGPIVCLAIAYAARRVPILPRGLGPRPRNRQQTLPLLRIRRQRNDPARVLSLDPPIQSP